jgi:GNAT superfamily N-acetyltransferase
LNKETLKEAIKLKIECWTEELNGIAENDLEFSKTYLFWLNWMNSAEEDNDFRILLGAFVEKKLIGTIFTSLAETLDHSNAIEINGLFLDKDFRNQGLSYSLMKSALKEYSEMNKTGVIVYSHRKAPSNSFYHHLGGKVIRTDHQMNDLLVVDVFLFDFNSLYGIINKKFHK